MSPFDHAVRAANLRILVDGHCHKLNDECYDNLEPAIEWDDEDDPEAIVLVPYRYAGLLWDGSASWIVFENDIAEMASSLLGGLNNEYPSGPDMVMDLDTGEYWTPVVGLDLVPAKALASAEKVLSRLNAGERPSDALRAAGFDPEDSAVMTEEHAGGDFSDPHNTIIDFCAHVLLRRVQNVEVIPGDKPRYTEVWTLETY